MKIERPTELPPEIAAKLEKRKRFPRARLWIFNISVAFSLVLFAGNYWMWRRGASGVEDHLQLFTNGSWYFSADFFGPSVFLETVWNAQSNSSRLSLSSTELSFMNPRAFRWFDFHMKRLVGGEIVGFGFYIPYGFL